MGKLRYLTITRPDITYAVGLVSQYMHAPCQAHLHVVYRILRYLKGYLGKGIDQERSFVLLIYKIVIGSAYVW